MTFILLTIKGTNKFTDIYILVQGFAQKHCETLALIFFLKKIFCLLTQWRIEPNNLPLARQILSQSTVSCLILRQDSQASLELATVQPLFL